jgi:branched-subunit amino acid ABC-type transport system permease component
MTFQPFANALVAASGILLIAIGFQCVFRVGKFFHFAHAALFAVAPYLMLLGTTWFRLPTLFSGILAVGATILLGLAIEWFCYRPIREVGNSTNTLLLSSLGILVALQSSMALFFGSESKTLRSAPVAEGLLLLSARVTSAQITIVSCAVVVPLGVWAFMRLTRTGKQMEAVADDRDLAQVVGIRIERIYLLAIGWASALAAVAGIVVSLDVDMTPTMGMQPLLLGVVAVIVGGNSILGTVVGALIIGGVQHIGTFWISSRWQDTIIFGTLILVLIMRPGGILAKPLRKSTV